DSQGVATIVDGQGPVGIYVDDVWLTEGNTAQFEVKLSTPAPSTVTVLAATAGGSATSGADFGTVSQTLTFLPNETSKIVAVPLNSDSAAEALETFTLKLTNPTNATVRDSAATGTIVDSGGPIGISVDNPVAPEGTGSQLTLTFTLTLSVAPA